MVKKILNFWLWFFCFRSVILPKYWSFNIIITLIFMYFLLHLVYTYIFSSLRFLILLLVLKYFFALSLRLTRCLHLSHTSIHYWCVFIILWTNSLDGIFTFYRFVSVLLYYSVSIITLSTKYFRFVLGTFHFAQLMNLSTIICLISKSVRWNCRNFCHLRCVSITSICWSPLINFSACIQINCSSTINRLLDSCSGAWSFCLKPLTIPNWLFYLHTLSFLIHMIIKIRLWLNFESLKWSWHNGYSLFLVRNCRR